MELEQQQETSNEATQAGAEAGTPATETPAPTPAPEGTAVETAPSYEPNWKYDFDGEQREVDPFWRPLVKDEESNKKVIEAFQMIDAFPKWKQKATEYSEVNDAVQQLSKWFASGDHERVLETLGYTDDMIKDIAIAKLQREKMSPEQRQAWEEKNRIKLENEKLLAQNQEYQTAAQRELERRTDFELDTELGKVEYKKLVDAYDGAHGSGAFKRYVATRGDAMVRSLGRHVTPSELVGSVFKEYQPFLQQQTVVEQPKVIPQVKSGSGTPGKKAVTSIADLKKLRSQMIED